MQLLVRGAEGRGGASFAPKPLGDMGGGTAVFLHLPDQALPLSQTQLAVPGPPQPTLKSPFSDLLQHLEFILATQSLVPGLAALVSIICETCKVLAPRWLMFTLVFKKYCSVAHIST
jgi:hypothetical protein